MATLTFSVTVPDAQVPRVVAALRHAFNAPDATQAELVAMFRQGVRDRLVSIVRTYETNQARKAAEEVVVAPIDAT